MRSALNDFTAHGYSPPTGVYGGDAAAAGGGPRAAGPMAQQSERSREGVEAVRRTIVNLDASPIPTVRAAAGRFVKRSQRFP